MIQQCAACGVVMWPVKSRCDNCMQPTVVWVQASGKATLYSFALMHQVYHPGFASEIPYIIAQVDLEEGLRILTNIVGCSSSDLQIGMPLEVTFEASLMRLRCQNSGLYERASCVPESMYLACW